LLELAEPGEPDILDDHIEAYVHGPDVLVARASFYGPALVRTGLEIAEDGLIDARIVGNAAAAHDPQTVKQLWHGVARFGA
jgi:hypothetical protein